jgi:hypothetical protein
LGYLSELHRRLPEEHIRDPIPTKGAAKMAERQRVPDLDQMDERAAHEFLAELYSLLSADRVLVREELWVVEGVVDYDGGREVDFVLILELREGKVLRETRYYADPFEASEERAEWFERMER